MQDSCSALSTALGEGFSQFHHRVGTREKNKVYTECFGELVPAVVSRWLAGIITSHLEASKPGLYAPSPPV